ncbi:hypothetical protein PR048_011144 [Dryococelus australis]|uniref:Uncharacterized protein n=1 Tax=Dryococelus australis TaxID=614101 RepID=A0ABQ9HM25_9NEOP|nr:hypothetical protein PR048_011144 [Dryococelus australis]
MMQAPSSVITQDIVREIKSGCIVYILVVEEARDEELAEQMSICTRYLHGTEINERLHGFIVGSAERSYPTAHIDFKLCRSRPNSISQSHTSNNPCSYVLSHERRLNLGRRAKNCSNCWKTIGLLKDINECLYSTLRHNVFMK